MEEFIKEANIRLFEARLAEATDPEEREQILKLLAEEKARPVTRTKRSGAGPSGKSGD